jgi:phage shock protein PspC (stress-responsive transcriptional regulator)
MEFSYDAVCDGWVVGVFACIAEFYSLKCYLATVKWILDNLCYYKVKLKIL